MQMAQWMQRTGFLAQPPAALGAAGGCGLTSVVEFDQFRDLSTW